MFRAERLLPAAKRRSTAIMFSRELVLRNRRLLCVLMPAALLLATAMAMADTAERNEKKSSSSASQSKEEPPSDDQVKEMAKRLGLSHPTLNRLEAGGLNNSLRVLEQLCRALRCKPGDLFEPDRLRPPSRRA